MDGLPAQLLAGLGRVDGVAAVVAGAVAHPVEVLGVAAHGGEDGLQHLEVAPLPVGADEVGLAGAALGEDVPHGAGVVLGVDPVAHVPAVAVELGAAPGKQVGDLAGDELLHVLVGPVVVGAVGDGRGQPVGAVPRPHEHVRRRLGAGVGRARAVGVVGTEAPRLVQGEVAVDLVGGHVVEAQPVPAGGLQQPERPLHVGPDKGLRVGDGVVVVALGGVVHDGVVAGHHPLQQPRVADVAHHELHPLGGQAGDVLGVAGVGELVEHGHVGLGAVLGDPAHEVAADEPAAAGDDDVSGGEGLLHGCSSFLGGGCHSLMWWGTRRPSATSARCLPYPLLP